MQNDDLLDSISELKKGSRLSLLMVGAGVLFLSLSIYYSASRLMPLERQVATLQEEIAQHEARLGELKRLVAAVDQAARPASALQDAMEGWVYVGRLSSQGAWAPRSERMAAPDDPAGLVVGASVKTLHNTSLVGRIESDAGSGSADQPGSAAPKIFIKPDTRLEVLDLQRQDSVGGGKQLWVKVKVAPAALLELG